MNGITRGKAIFSSVAAIAAPALVMPKFARVSEFNLKFGTNLPASHPLNIRATEAAEQILKKTGGQVQLNVFLNYRRLVLSTLSLLAFSSIANSHSAGCIPCW